MFNITIETSGRLPQTALGISAGLVALLLVRNQHTRIDPPQVDTQEAVNASTTTMQYSRRLTRSITPLFRTEVLNLYRWYWSVLHACRTEYATMQIRACKCSNQITQASQDVDDAPLQRGCCPATEAWESAASCPSNMDFAGPATPQRSLCSLKVCPPSADTCTH
jgi:hypothetical protein